MTTIPPAAYYFPPERQHRHLRGVSWHHYNQLLSFLLSRNFGTVFGVRTSCSFGQSVGEMKKITVRFRRHSRYHFVLSHLPLLPKLRLDSSVQGVHLTLCCCLQQGSQQHFLAVNQHSYLFFFSFWPALAQLEREHRPLDVETDFQSMDSSTALSLQGFLKSSASKKTRKALQYMQTRSNRLDFRLSYGRQPRCMRRLETG